MSYTHLHLHSEYSLLDGACRIKDLVKAVKAKGMDSVAITDHGVMYGVVDFYNAATKEGIKPIIGCEVYVAKRSRFDKVHALDSESYHLVLLCENNKGYENLCKLVSLSNTEGFYYRPRVDKELLSQYSEGLIALSACLQGEIPKALLNESFDKASQIADEYIKIFGKDNFFFEIQNHQIKEQQIVLSKITKLSQIKNIPLVATNDVHYLEKEDAKMQKTLLLIGTNKTINDEQSFEFPNDEFYLKTEQEMLELFDKNAVEMAAIIAQRCNVTFEFNQLKLPKFTAPDNKTNLNYFVELCKNGLKQIFEKVENEKKQTYIERLEYEIKVIHSMGFVDYFLIVADFVRFAKANQIPVGPGRGSGAASLAAYCLAITAIDPIKYNLIFERFLNPQRVSMPDFDIDFCYIRRQEVIDYVIKKYGADHVAQIITFGTLAARAAIRDVGRALAIPYSAVDSVAKLVPSFLNVTLEQSLKTPELKKIYDSEATIKEMLDMALKIEGMPRNSSTHAAGVVITDKPVSSYVPLSLNDEAVVTQYPMTQLEQIGLLKMDFLGLRYLTVIDDCCKMVKLTNPNFNINSINLEDKKVFDLFCKGETEGIFQFESIGIRRVMTRLLPESIEDLTALTSLYRPGPMQSIDKYIENRHNPSLIKYQTKELEPILSVTYGCIVYQEQVMQVFRDLASYSLGKADIVRRAMAKKKHDVLLKEKEIFLKGCLINGIDSKIAKDLFDEILQFSSYAFNKAHAAAYSTIAYQTAYLKVYYPSFYMAALLTSVLGSANKVAEYIEESNRLKINLLPPHINNSCYNFSVENQNIRFGLLAIKNIGRNLIDRIIQEREQNGQFQNLFDFCKRVSSRDLNKRAVEALIKCGALDNLGYNKREMLESLDEILDVISSDRSRNIEGQIGLFDSFNAQKSSDFDIKSYKEFDTNQLLKLEKEVVGFYLSGHPMAQLKEAAYYLNFDSITKLANETNDFNYKDNDRVKFVGMIESITKKTTRNNDTMAFINVEDHLSSIECIVFPKPFAIYNQFLKPDQIVLITGRINFKEDRPPQILIDTMEQADKIADKILVAKEIKATKTQNNQISEESSSNILSDDLSKIVYLKLPSAQSERFEQAIQLIKANKGNCEVVIYCEDTKKALKSKHKLALSKDIIERLIHIVGRTNIKIKN